ncbi:craniofacial development protein 2-like [Capsicum annuum]|uniref:craniofacial development protein 2-like n=1 Tax=Capsicum annuum TaxID=4072 RepID=UPI001FB16D24|nr:craniofacial development protein 2-like [Capsicum annuum]
MSIKLVMGGSTVNVISAYAPQVGLDEEEKKEFWEVLDKVVRSIPSTEKLFVGGDFNEHIGSLSRGYDNVYGGFDFGERNEGGASLLDFSRAFGLWIANSSFLKKEDHLITFRSSWYPSQTGAPLMAPPALPPRMNPGTPPQTRGPEQQPLE